MFFAVETQLLKSLKYYNCHRYNKTAKYILLLQFLCSPVWWSYVHTGPAKRPQHTDTAVYIGCKAVQYTKIKLSITSAFARTGLKFNSP
jgi:hypothetical protein